MHYAAINNISKAFGVRSLFKNISFNIEEGDKIALVARNGTGKTTLLKIITGKETADEGTVWVHKDVKVVMLEQEAPYEPAESVWDNVLGMDNPVANTVKAYELALENNSDDFSMLLTKMEELNAWNFENELNQILGKLNIHHLSNRMGTLSGGQRKRVALAKALIEVKLHQGHCLLVMDEPTNHLDVSMIEWLEDYLSSARVTLLMVTHDRYFLDAVCNEIIEIDNNEIFVYRGDYDYFLAQKVHRQEVAASELQKDKNIFRRELEWMRKQPKARTTKSKSREDAFDVLDKKLKQQTEVSDISLQVKMTRIGGKVLEMKKVYKSYGDMPILKGFDYTFKRGERIGVVGKNGVGKSTFIRIALNEEQPDSGKVNHGDTIVFGHFSQDGLVYKEDKRAIEYVKDLAEFFPLADGSKISASQFMEKFGFTPEQQYTPLSKLSGGEKRRLHLLGILFKNPNFLVLDEPTNDLDLQTLRILEEFLQDYPGCILIVSHDRYFMDRIVDHLFAFEGDGFVRDFPGNYTQYRKFLETQQETSPGSDPDKSEPPKTTVKTTQPKKAGFKEKFEFEQIDKELPALQTERIALEETLASTTDYEALQKASERLEMLIAEIEQKEMRWLELSELL